MIGIDRSRGVGGCLNGGVWWGHHLHSEAFCQGNTLPFYWPWLQAALEEKKQHERNNVSVPQPADLFGSGLMEFGGKWVGEFSKR